MSQRDLTPAEESLVSLHNFTLSVFEERYGKDAITGVKLIPLVHERWVTVFVTHRTQQMVDIAKELEGEFLEDLGRYVSIFIKQPWKGVIRSLAGRMLSWVK